MNSYLRLLSYIKPYKLRLISAIICMIIAAGCNLYLPWIIKDMIDDVLLNKDMETMKWICIGVVVVFLIRGVFYFGQTYLVSYVGQRVIVDVRSQLFKKFQRFCDRIVSIYIGWRK